MKNSKGYKMRIDNSKLPNNTVTETKNIVLQPFINDPLVHELRLAPRKRKS